MIDGRSVGRAWDVFQHGHMSFYYTDGRGIARGPYLNRDDAERERGIARGDGPLRDYCGDCLFESVECSYPDCLSREN